MEQLSSDQNEDKFIVIFSEPTPPTPPSSPSPPLAVTHPTFRSPPSHLSGSESRLAITFASKISVEIEHSLELIRPVSRYRKLGVAAKSIPGRVHCTGSVASISSRWKILWKYSPGSQCCLLFVCLLALLVCMSK